MSTQSNDGYGNGEFIRHEEMTLNHLPAGFTWRSLYEKFKPFMDGDKVKHVQLNELHGRYRFDVDFIKARCFEEIEPNLPTRDEWHILAYAILGTYSPREKAASNIINKLELISLDK